MMLFEMTTNREISNAAFPPLPQTGPWTEEEDRKVISLVMAHGDKKWSQIAAELPGRIGK